MYLEMVKWKIFSKNVPFLSTRIDSEGKVHFLLENTKKMVTNIFHLHNNSIQNQFWIFFLAIWLFRGTVGRIRFQKVVSLLWLGWFILYFGYFGEPWIKLNCTFLVFDGFWHLCSLKFLGCEYGIHDLHFSQYPLFNEVTGSWKEKAQCYSH